MWFLIVSIPDLCTKHSRDFVQGCNSYMVQGGRNSMGCFVQCGKSVWDVLYRVAMQITQCVLQWDVLSGHCLI